MSDSLTTAAPEATNTASIAHIPVREHQVESEFDQSQIAGQRIMRSMGGGSPIAPPDQFAGALGKSGMLQQLQRGYGNSYVGSVVQAKLTVGRPGDVYEQEADKVADAVMRMPELPVSVVAGVTKHVQPMLIQRMCTTCQHEEEEQIHPKELVGQVPTITPTLETRLNATSGGGEPLSDSVRAFMEPRIGADLGRVRVHTGGEANALNRELNAQAFTYGRDVYFGAGKAPAKDTLTAHELTHVVQQTGMVQAQNNDLSDKRDDPTEKDKLISQLNELDSKIIAIQVEYEVAVTRKDESLQKLKDIKRELARLKREEYLISLYSGKDINEPAETIIKRCQQTSANELETIQLIHGLSGGREITSTIQDVIVKSPELFPHYVMNLYSSVIAEFSRQSQEEKEKADTLLKPHLTHGIDEIEDEYLAMIKNEKGLQDLSIDINYWTILDQNSPLILDKKNLNSTDIGINNIKVGINELRAKASGLNPLLGGSPETGLGFLYDVLVAYYFYDLYKEMAGIMDSYRQATEKTYESLDSPNVEGDLKDLYAMIGSRQVVASVVGGGNKSGGYAWVSKQFENKLDPWIASQSMARRVGEGITIYYRTHNIKSEVWEGVKAAFTLDALLTLLGFITLILLLNSIPFGGPIAAKLLEDYFLAEMIDSFEPFLRYAWTAANAITFRSLYSSTSILEGMITQVTMLVVQWLGLKSVEKFAKYSRDSKIKDISDIRNDPAIKDASPGVKEAYKKGEMSNKEFEKWEKTLDTDFKTEFQQNPELRKTWAEMDPDARRILTRCGSPCIPKGAKPEHGAQIKSMIQRLDVSGDLEVLLKEYFYKNRGNIDAAIEITNGAKTIEGLESIIKPELDLKNVEKYEVIKTRRLAEIEAKRKAYEESQARVKSLDEAIAQSEHARAIVKEEFRNERKKNSFKEPLNEVEQKLLDEININTKEIGKFNEKKYQEIRSGQGITPELYKQLRKRSPGGQVRSDTISRAKGIDEVFGNNEKTEGKSLETDHVVSMREITEMKDFNRLTFEQQVEVLNNPDNLIAMNESANASKGSRSWSEWDGWKEFTNDIRVKNKMLNKEVNARNLLQDHIQRLLVKNK
jgi:hypothetical protein